MKKMILSVLLLAAPLATFAQLKVYSNGKTGIARTNSSCYQPLTVGEYAITENYYNVSCISRVSTDWKSYNIGLDGHAYYSGVHAGRAIGTRGTAGNATNGYNYGVLGALILDKNGAGIYGTTSNVLGGYVDGKYAGFFAGNTKVDGLLTVTSGIDGDLMGIPANSLLRTTNALEQSVSNRLQNLQTFSYYQQAPQRTRSTDLRADTTETEAYVPAIARQAQEHRHYGFSSEQMEEAFPELVYEKEDGTKLINYKELIPILVQSVNELNAEIARLKGLKDNEEARSMTNESEETAVSQISEIAPVLYQNTPNPFSERTAIRFSLPDNAQNAYIYIFDMTGKMQKQIPVDASMESVTINGYELSAGMYIYSLVVNGKEMDTKRMILSK